jgi:hypothetical protein
MVFHQPNMSWQFRWCPEKRIESDSTPIMHMSMMCWKKSKEIWLLKLENCWYLRMTSIRGKSCRDKAVSPQNMNSFSEI